MSGDRFVCTQAIRAAVRGHEAEVLSALGINPRGRAHITCPFPDHDDANPSWRWDELKGRAHCTCANGHALSIFDVLCRVEAIDFGDAKIRVAELIDRSDLIEEKGARTGQKMTASILLAPPAGKSAPTLPRAYLAHRLGVALDLVPMPTTPTAGWSTLPYWDPPAEKGGQPRLVAETPCVVFGTLAPDGRTHAHRVYVQSAGSGKADLGGAIRKSRRRSPKAPAPAAARWYGAIPNRAPGCCSPRARKPLRRSRSRSRPRSRPVRPMSSPASQRRASGVSSPGRQPRESPSARIATKRSGGPSLATRRARRRPAGSPLATATSSRW